MTWFRRLLLALALAAAACAYAQDIRWSLSGAIRAGRHWHRTEALLDGRLIIMGGITGSERYVDGTALNGMTTNACELYDPVNRTTIDAAPMNVPRSEFPSVVTPTGTVLVFGGLTGESERGPCTSAIEEYDPTTNTWSIVGSLSVDRRRHAAIMIDDRRVLIVGGCPTDRIALPLCEIYDIVDRTTERVGDLPQPLKEGSLHMVEGVPTYVGGREGGPNSPRQSAPYAYDVTTGTWASMEGTGMPAISTSVSLDDGSMVVCGGNIGEWPPNFSRAVYHMSGGVARRVTTMQDERTLHAMVGMGGRTVMVSGGINNALTALSSTLLVDVATDQVLVQPEHVIARAYHSLVRTEHPTEGTTFYAISGMQGDQTLTNTIEKLSIGTEDGLINLFVGVDEDLSQQADVFPNPCTDRLSVAMDEGSTVHVMDMSGRALMSGTATDAHRTMLDVEALAAGMYQLVYTRGGRVRHTTMIKR